MPIAVNRFVVNPILDRVRARHRARNFRVAPDLLDAGSQFVLVERLGEIVVGTEAKSLELLIRLGKTGQDEYAVGRKALLGWERCSAGGLS